MKKSGQKGSKYTPNQGIKSRSDHIRDKKRKLREQGLWDITVYEKDYTYNPPRLMPYTYELVKSKVSQEDFRKNVHYLCDLDEEPGTPVDALRKERVPGRRLPSLSKVKQFNPNPQKPEK